MKDKMGDRLKSNYENRTKTFLTRRSYHFIRLDGKAFHTYTKNCKRPYDLELMEDMDLTAKYILERVQGAKCAFVQSDEITILFTDNDSINTEMFFDGNIQKIVSTTASMAGAKFNQRRMKRLGRVLEDDEPLAAFDSRVFTVPDFGEVPNIIIWRQLDAIKNSVQMVAQANFSHNECQNKHTDELKQMLIDQKGVNWKDCPMGFQRGRFIQKEEYVVEAGTTVNKKGKTITVPEHTRNHWVVKESPDFLVDRDIIYALISKNEA
jgi:tRNA(His) 5'-end guanylyltransferase